jgi:hypothetical protein
MRRVCNDEVGPSDERWRPLVGLNITIPELLHNLRYAIHSTSTCRIPAPMLRSLFSAQETMQMNADSNQKRFSADQCLVLHHA